MADNPLELRKHLAFARAARGRVLVTGLGLGCVVRMLQANPRVEHITLVEIDQNVIDLVWPHTPHDRVELVHGDALEYLATCNSKRWDFAWHDIWTDTDTGQPHLQLAHMHLMLAAHHRVRFQGAWEYPRRLRWRANARINPDLAAQIIEAEISNRSKNIERQQVA